MWRRRDLHFLLKNIYINVTAYHSTNLRTWASPQIQNAHGRNICLEIRNDRLINGKYNIICYLGHTITPLWPGPVNRRRVVVWHQIKEEEWPWIFRFASPPGQIKPAIKKMSFFSLSLSSSECGTNASKFLPYLLLYVLQVTFWGWNNLLRFKSRRDDDQMLIIGLLALAVIVPSYQNVNTGILTIVYTVRRTRCNYSIIKLTSVAGQGGVWGQVN